MSSSRHNTYLHTRVSILAARLLNHDNLAKLPQLDLERIGALYGLEPVLDDTLPASTRNHAVERALIRTLLSELSVLIRPMQGEGRELLLYWARKFELYNLKALIRGKLSAMPEQEISDNLYEVPDALALPHQALLRTESVLELLRRLEQSPYRAIARQARHVYEERHEPFALEATVDQQYYAGLVKRVREMQGTDLKEMQQVVGITLDQLNLLWVLRYRFSYGLSASETYYQLAPSVRKLHRGELLKLVNLSSLEKVISSLPPPLDSLLESAATTVEVERRMDTYSARETRKILLHSPSSVARAFAYLILREMDLRKLFAVVQGKVLGLNNDLQMYALGLGDEESVMGAARV